MRGNFKYSKMLIAAVCIAAAVTGAALYSAPTFKGSRVKNPDAYLMDIERMNGTDEHTMKLKKGESLSKIANKYGTSVSALCKLNGISTKTKIQPGKVLRVK